MGATKVDLGKGTYEIENYNLSDIWCIENLIENRIDFDDVYKSKLFETSNPYYASDIPVFKELFFCLYLDLENIIKKINLDDKENLVIEKLMLGYTHKDISDLYLFSDARESKSILRKIALKIKKQNDKERIEWYKNKGFYVPEKECSKCGKTMSITEFSLNKKGKFGRHSVCNDCKKNNI